jgi:hypothetical protein
MGTDRREFLGSLLAVGVAPIVAGNRTATAPSHHSAPSPSDTPFDVSWTQRVNGQHRALFDSPEVSEGLALLRTLVWFKDYADVYSTTPDQMSAVVVIRHNGIWMAMNDEFWAAHGIGAMLKISDPKTTLPITRNPFLGPTPFPDLPPSIADGVLTKVLATSTVLACNLAFQDVVEKVKADHVVDAAKAREMALAHLMPGIIMQPSGVFAVTRAQEAGCQYMLAS